VTSSIVKHWRQLSGSVHPADEVVFGFHSHSFNLEFPPPAFIGDIENAPVVLLDANGGYDPQITPMEFAAEGSRKRYLDLLHNPRPVNPGDIAPYYGRRNYSHLIKSGRLALVNAVAYRSVGISREPQNRKLAEQLPSTQVHRNWLRQELLEQAKAGERLVIAHRNGLWRFKKTEGPIEGVVFTTNPVSADLSIDTLSKIEQWSRR
jgi:hypothetical protein